MLTAVFKKTTVLFIIVLGTFSFRAYSSLRLFLQRRLYAPVLFQHRLELTYRHKSLASTMRR